MCLSPNILPAFEQLGLYEELLSFSKPALRSTFYTGDLEVIAESETLTTESVGYDRILFARTKLYELLFKKIPAEKVHKSKKIVSFEQSQDGVTLTFDDSTTARGDILVGADGAHSAVRQQLYKALDNDGILPKADTKEMGKGYISLVGTTDALDTTKYPGLLKEDSECHYMIGDKSNPYTWITFTVPENRVCWNVIIQLGLDPIADEQIKNLDWTPQQHQKKLLDSLRHFRTPNGTLGDLFDATPLDQVCKVSFEDVLFDTWNHGRTVLIGDGMLLPTSGAGAVNAMQDAVLLANHIYDIKRVNFENIKTALKEYKEERFDSVKDQYSHSHMSAKLILGHTFWERVLRQIIFNWVPQSLLTAQLVKDTAYRPQANFLPQAPKRGTIDVLPQKPSKRVQEQEEAQNKAVSAI
ncbi:hypothetical protein BGZ95_006025 [Linnemannia exigua]|uniref:FAD-binding domain-containing protein n=1 Tax=Linnemannia exigua TaxID=604196 RepID=A0AAD4DLF6_9FUNG|nr:hypothetical protein BGZ95_006025 [Linnemannia exigua]